MLEGFGGCRALVAPRPLPSAAQARTVSGEISSLAACTGKVRVRPNCRNARQITIGRAWRSLVGFEVGREERSILTVSFFRLSNTREYAVHSLVTNRHTGRPVICSPGRRGAGKGGGAQVGRVSCGAPKQAVQVNDTGRRASIYTCARSASIMAGPGPEGIERERIIFALPLRVAVGREERRPFSSVARLGGSRSGM